MAVGFIRVIKSEDGTAKRKKINIKFTYLWLSATLDVLIHACLLALSHSGRHGRNTLYVPAAVVLVLDVLRLVAVLLLLVLPLCTKELKKHVRIERTRTRQYESREGKEKLERSSK